MEFVLKNNNPCNSGPYRKTYEEANVIDEKVEELLEYGLIRESQGPWSAPCFCVNKKDGSKRMVIDYRKLNEQTESYIYPIPRMDECIDSLNGSQFFCVLDLFSGYHQIPIAEKDQNKTAFITRNGVYKFTRLPFGLKNAPGWFQNRISDVLRKELGKSCLVYIDDIIIFAREFKETITKN